MKKIFNLDDLNYFNYLSLPAIFIIYVFHVLYYRKKINYKKIIK